MNKRLFLFLLLLCHAAAFAQFKTIAEGPAFDEPEDGHFKILQLKNGGTVFIMISEKGGITVQLYDKSHKQKADKRLEPAYGKLGKWSLNGFFEVNGDAVLFINESEKKNQALYRLIIDGKTGALKKEEKIWNAPETAVFRTYSKKSDDIGEPHFSVSKAPGSEHYSISLVNGFTTEENKRIEIALYDGNHKETGRSFYRSGNDQDIRYLTELGSVMVDSTTVCHLTTIGNFAGKKEKKYDLGLVCLKAGNITINKLSYAKGMALWAFGGVIKYNPAAGKLLLLTNVYDWNNDDAKSYTSLATVDLATLKEVDVKTPKSLKIEEASKGVFNKHPVNFYYTYSYTPQDIIIHDDGSYTILFQGMIRKDRPSGAYEFFNSDIGVNNYDVNGKALKSYLVTQEHLMFKLEPASFDHNKINRTGITLGRGDHYKYFSYLFTKAGKRYVLINDVEENERLAQKGKQTIVQGVRNCDAFYFDANADQVMPARNFVFANQGKAEDHRLLMNTVSDYDREHNIYATLKLDPRKQTLQMVWLEL